MSVAEVAPEIAAPSLNHWYEVAPRASAANVAGSPGRRRQSCGSVVNVSEVDEEAASTAALRSIRATAAGLSGRGEAERMAGNSQRRTSFAGISVSLKCELKTTTASYSGSTKAYCP
ncbi:MAG: hypothetical protein BWX86_02171 [Verrucomicrobia bacterium ADurb.Bin122]|nr:MAG: hypothetical protein BWX86_02171 [Verrucomicrobia bacterium ADurb.Bin122]